jgi:hypothetical protein
LFPNLFQTFCFGDSFFGGIFSDDSNHKFIIVFFVGGATFEEAAAVAALNAANPNQRIILGGTYIHNSQSYVVFVFPTLWQCEFLSLILSLDAGSWRMCRAAFTLPLTSNMTCAKYAKEPYAQFFCLSTRFASQ